MPDMPPLLSVLADGLFHSGEALGASLGVSRAAVWKQISTLRNKGLRIQSVPGKGYRLVEGFDPLDAEFVRAEVAALGGRPGQIVYVWETDSTNNLVRSLARSPQTPAVAVADSQTAGRGRRGKSWYSARPGNLAFSMAHEFETSPANLGGLSLAAGLAVARVLMQAGVFTQLKWPNDLLVEGRKLGGILMEVSAESGGPTTVITGLGLNLRGWAIDGAGIDQPWGALDEWLADMPVRNRLLAALIVGIDRMFVEFQEKGLGSVLDAWAEFDYLKDKDILVELGNRRLSGLARGLDAQGDLLVETPAGIQAVNAGEVSVRRAI